jgi:hypothetical protein
VYNDAGPDGNVKRDFKEACRASECLHVKGGSKCLYIVPWTVSKQHISRLGKCLNRNAQSELSRCELPETKERAENRRTSLRCHHRELKAPRNEREGREAARSIYIASTRKAKPASVSQPDAATTTSICDASHADGPGGGQRGTRAANHAITICLTKEKRGASNLGIWMVFEVVAGAAVEGAY